MPVNTADKRVILVVGEEEVFYELLQRFSPESYAIKFVATNEGAGRMVSAQCPDLAVLSVSDLRAGVPEYLSKVRCAGVPVLGVTPGFQGSGPDPDELPRALIDRLATDRRTAVDGARELLGERRRLPRVVVGIEVTIDDHHWGHVRDLSPDALRVETAAPLEEGQHVPLAFDWGERSVRTSGVVLSCSGDDLQTVIFKLLDDSAVEALDRLVRKVLEVDHYREERSQASTAGPAAWQQARRAEHAFRQTGALRRAATAQEIPVAKAAGLAARYELGERLVSWGTGELIEATERLRDQPVWLKVLDKGLRGDGPARARLEVEATAGSELADLPGVVSVLDFGSDARGGLYYALDRLEGETLAAAQAAGRRFGAREIARLGAQLSDTLAEARRRGHAHHDLCPDNVFLQRAAGGRVVARLLGFAGDLPPAPADRTHALGASYWPPEGPDELPWDRADTYALCALLREVWSRTRDEERVPAGAEAAIQQLWQVLQRGAASLPSLRFDRLAGLSHAFRECSEDLDAAIAGPPATVARRAEVKTSMPAPEEGTADPPTSAISELRSERRSAAVGRRQAMVGAGALAASVCMLGLVWISPWKSLAGPVPLALTPSGESSVRSERTTARRSIRARRPMPAAMAKNHLSVPAVLRPSAPAPVAVLAVPASTTTVGEPAAKPSAEPEPTSRSTSRERRRWYLNRGRYLLDKGLPLGALRAFERALRQGDSYRLRVYLARAHEDAGQRRQAIHHLRRAAAVAPRSWKVQLRLGRLLVEVGRKQAACRAFRTASDRKPNHPGIRDHLRRFCGVGR